MVKINIYKIKLKLLWKYKPKLNSTIKIKLDLLFDDKDNLNS